MGGGGFGGGGLGGGVYLDPEGVLRGGRGGRAAPKPIEPELPRALAARSDLRRVSLKGLALEIEKTGNEPGKLPEAVRRLAGLTGVEFLFLDRANKDVFLCGPAEGWTIEPDGRALGKSSRRPILELDDLVVALRCVLDGPGEAGCSIDPTRAGLAALKELSADSVADRREAEAVRKEILDRLGLQTVRTSGVPEGSRFALAMIDADYRMKRIAIGIENVRGLVSHMDVVVALTEEGRKQHSLARWWFAPWYERIECDGERTVFRLVGQGMRLLNEEVLFDETGMRTPTGRPNPDWDRFAASFTDKLPDLMRTHAAFADLKNLYDLMLAAGILRQEGAGAWLEGGALLEESKYRVATFSPPTRAEPVASCRVHSTREGGRRRQLVSWAFGGVTIRPEDVLGEREKPAAGPIESMNRIKEKLTSNEPEAALEEVSWWSDEKAGESPERQNR